MLELLNQLDGFSSHHDIKVNYYYYYYYYFYFFQFYLFIYFSFWLFSNLVCKVKVNCFFIQFFTNFTKKPGILTEHACVFKILVETSC